MLSNVVLVFLPISANSICSRCHFFHFASQNNSTMEPPQRVLSAEGPALSRAAKKQQIDRQVNVHYFATTKAIILEHAPKELSFDHFEWQGVDPVCMIDSINSFKNEIVGLKFEVSILNKKVEIMAKENEEIIKRLDELEKNTSNKRSRADAEL